VAFSDSTQGNKLTVKKYSAGSWTTIGTAGMSAGSAMDIHIGIYNSAPVVSYIDDTNYYPFVVINTAGTDNWTSYHPQDLFTYTASLCVKNGTIYAFYCAATGSSPQYSSTVFTFNGSSWHTLASSNSLPEGAGNDNFIYADSSSSVYVAFMDVNNSYRTNVYRYNGSSWSPLGTQPLSASQGNNNSITVVGGIPYICILDDTGSIVYVKKYE
jgi:hypothetical protein